MDTAAFEEALARELFGQELGRDISSRRLAEVIQVRTSWTFQKWLSGEVRWGHDADLVWAALFTALGKERLWREFIHADADRGGPDGNLSDAEWRRVRRVAQMLRRGRYVGSEKARFINEDDVYYLRTGEMPGGRYIPLCTSSGPPYVSRDDVEQLHLFVLEDFSGESVAFSYMDPVGPGLPGRSLEVHGVVQDFHELPARPERHARDRILLLSRAWRSAKRSSRAFEDRMGLKLVGVEPVLAEEKGEAPEVVVLNLQFSDYFKGRVTNHILDAIIPGRSPLPLRQDGDWKITYRDEWCGSMASFGDCLANLMQVNGLVITTGDPGPPRVHLGVRGAGVATNPRSVGEIPYTPSTSGAAAQGRYGERREIDVDALTGEIRYDPKVTLLREGAEEVWGRETQGQGRAERSGRRTVEWRGDHRPAALYLYTNHSRTIGLRKLTNPAKRSQAIDLPSVDA